MFVHTRIGETWEWNSEEPFDMNFPHPVCGLISDIFFAKAGRIGVREAGRGGVWRNVKAGRRRNFENKNSEVFGWNSVICRDSSLLCIYKLSFRVAAIEFFF